MTAAAARKEVPTVRLIGALSLLVVTLAMLSLVTGRSGTIGGAGDLLAVSRTDPGTAWLILSQVRLPRVALSILVGASLGLSGAVLQGFLRNPLAEPGLLGASSAAALGAVIVFYFGTAGLSFLLPVGGMMGTLLATALLLRLSGRGQETLTLILAGTAINSLTAALTSLALNFAPSPYAAVEIVFWIMGSFADRTLQHVVMALPPMVVGWGLLLTTGPALDALTLGEEAASSLGFDLRRTRLLTVLGTAFCIGAAVSITGVISFVGLVVPHLIRPLVGNRPARLLVSSMLGGAALMTAADIGTRIIPTSMEVKVGVVTALIGAPFFLHLLATLRRSDT